MMLTTLQPALRSVIVVEWTWLGLLLGGLVGLRGSDDGPGNAVG